MGALIGVILKTPGLTSLLGAAAESGAKRLSKTKIGANLAVVGAGWEALPTLIPAVLAGDAESIGKLVLIVGGWALALWGRGNKG